MEKKDTCRGALTVEVLLFLIPFMMAFLTIINAGRFVQSEMLIHHAITHITDQMISTNNKSSKFKTDASNTVDSVKNFSNSVSDFTTTGDLQSVIDSGNAAYTQLSDFFSDPDAIATGVMSMVKSDIRGAAMTYVAGELSRASIKNSIGKVNDDVDTYLTNLGIVDGLSGLDFSQTKWISVGEGKGDVQIVVTYTMKNNIFPQFDFGEYEVRQCASTLMW